MPRAARMNENSPICARLAEIVSAVSERVAEREHDREGREGLADMMISTTATT